MVSGAFVFFLAIIRFFLVGEVAEVSISSVPLLVVFGLQVAPSVLNSIYSILPLIVSLYEYVDVPLAEELQKVQVTKGVS